MCYVKLLQGIRLGTGLLEAGGAVGLGGVELCLWWQPHSAPPAFPLSSPSSKVILGFLQGAKLRKNQLSSIYGCCFAVYSGGWVVQDGPEAWDSSLWPIPENRHCPNSSYLKRKQLNVFLFKNRKKERNWFCFSLPCVTARTLTLFPNGTGFFFLIFFFFKENLYFNG